jgi:colanic acid/amylovoran biosynthesis glycosyltransferase
VVLRVVGEGELRPSLEKLVRELGLDDVITFVGRVAHKDVMREMLECHIFVLPSVTAATGDQEGSGTVLLEAQLAGAPVVATDYGGIRETVANGRSGILVPEKDPQALADAIGQLLDHSERWPEMGAAGREHVVSGWSTEVHMRRLLDIYASVMECAGR